MSITDISVHLAVHELPEDFRIYAHLRVDSQGEDYVVWQIKMPDTQIRFFVTSEQWAQLTTDMKTAQMVVAEEHQERAGVDPDAPVHELAEELVSCGDCGTTHAAGADCPVVP